MNGSSKRWQMAIMASLVVLIVLQVWTMIQSDRLYLQLNRIADSLSGVTMTSSQSDETKQAMEGDEGDWLIWRLSAEPATLNELHASAGMATRWIVSGEVGGNIFETLLQYNKDTLELEPFLAESFHVSPDGLEITFTLRDDVHFSDGRPLTVDDVLFTYETIANPKVDAADLASYLTDVKEAIRVDGHTVKFLMKQPYWYSLVTLGGLPIYPKHIYQFEDPETFNKQISDPVGSGPFVFDRWDVGSQVILKRNDNYWGPRAKLDRIVYKFITNDKAAIQSMREGQIDYMRPLPDQFTELSQDTEFTKEVQCLSYWYPATGFFWIGWNQARPFFADQRVRLAMTHAIDRETICKKLLNSPDAKVPTGPFYIYGPQSNPDIKPWPFDPDRARQLLDEAGWIDTNRDGIRDKNSIAFRFKFMIVGGTYLHEQIAKLVKDQAAKIGIQVDIDPYEWSIFIQRVQERNFDAVNMAWGGTIESDPYQLWHSSQIGNHGSNYCGFNVPEADRLIEEARRTLDPTARNKLYHQFHQIIHDLQPYTFVYTRPGQRFLHGRFSNVVIHKAGLDEREWFVPARLQKY
ncbi:MAG: peptide-binding protein [Sedimentisphaerales bacterium]|nr:peptide-binding protein [Sedimentisphaerales bacterium]